MDETAKSFMPEEEDIELIKFMKHQEELLKQEAKKLKESKQFEELKEEDDDVKTKMHQQAKDLIDNYVGRYKTAEDLIIGDRDLDSLVEVKEKNQQLFRNFRKFETQCKKHPTEEKSRLVFIWCKKMLKAWEDEILSFDNEHLQSALGK